MVGRRTRQPRFQAREACAYFERTLAPSMEANLRRGGISSSAVDELLVDLQACVRQECERRGRVTPCELWTYSYERSQELVQRHLDEQHREDREITERASQSYVLETSERFRKETAELLRPDRQEYRADPLLLEFDRRALELWQENPELSMRALGRELQEEFGREHPGSVPAMLDETFASERILVLLNRLCTGETTDVQDRRVVLSGLSFDDWKRRTPNRKAVVVADRLLERLAQTRKPLGVHDALALAKEVGGEESDALLAIERLTHSGLLERVFLDLEQDPHQRLTWPEVVHRLGGREGIAGEAWRSGARKMAVHWIRTQPE